MRKKGSNFSYKEFRLSSLRLHQIMYNMFYPAVLGGMIYSLFVQAAETGFHASNPKPWLAFPLFIALFTLDYTYSLARKIVDEYSLSAFGIDLLIVVLMFIVSNSILDKNVVPVSIWIELATLKFVVSFWEFWRDKKRQASGSLLETKYFVTDFILFLVCISFAVMKEFGPLPYEWALLSLVFIVDILIYLPNTSDA